MSDFGGNRVEKINLQQTTEHFFAKSPYSYALYKLSNGKSLDLSALGSFTVYIYDCPAGSSVSIAGNKAALSKGDALQVEASAVTLNAQQATVLVAGVKDRLLPPSITAIPADKLKKVMKPWGHELWINGEHPGYAFKQIFIRAPHKTSLQYHHFKQETNILLDGQARLHFKKDATVENDHMSAEHVGTHDLAPVSSVSVVPEIVHRIEALSDVLLYEVSTPHLDDVIRISDDSKRPHGRIDSEHVRS